MKKLIYLVSGVMILFIVSSCQDNKRAKNYNTNEVVDEDGSAFIKKGLEAGLTEIKAAKLAQINSKNPRIIGFAKMMITDHTTVGDELEKIGINKRVMEGDTINTDHQKMIAALSSKLGVIFDEAYIQMMLKDHEDAVSLFTKASQNKDAEIQSFAKKTLTTLKMHLDSAKAIGASLK